MLTPMNDQNQGTERLVLPPISTLEEYIPKRNSITMLSPPCSFTPSSTSSSSFSSGHSPVLFHHPPSPPRTAFEKMDSPLYPYSNNTDNSNKNTNLRTVSSDIDQVVQHAHGLYDNMVHYKPYLLSSDSNPQHDDELRPWMDEMIGKANQVLNALLRIRKQQMAVTPTTSLQSDQHEHSFSHHPSFSSNSSNTSISSPQSSPQSSSAKTSSQITITKRDWPKSHYQPMSNHSVTSIPSRQRKRGKRSTFQGRCHSCNISETPEWRRGPDGARTLCNACGLHYAKLARKKAAAAANTVTGSPPSSLNNNNAASI